MTEIKLTNVEKIFGGAVKILEGINLEIESGELIVLLGPSGCGKSTLLRMIAGLETITSGTLEIEGQVVNDVPGAKRGIAMVFQSYGLYPHMNVHKNMSFALELAKKSRQVINTTVTQAARMLQMGPYLERLPKALSGGQRQRVAIGRAIVRDPKVYLFDEPLSNLDAALRVATRIEIAQLKESMPESTMIYVTHDQVEAMTMGHRIAVLNQGRLQQLGTPMELYRWPSNLFVAQFIGSPPMNVLPVQVGRSQTLHLGERRVSVEGPLSAALAGFEGQRLHGGIRPENLKVAPATNRNLQADVSHSEVLGNEQLITCRLLDGEHLVQVRADPGLRAIPGSRIHLDADPHGWRLFDDQGDAIPMPTPPSERDDTPVLPDLT